MCIILQVILLKILSCVNIFHNVFSNWIQHFFFFFQLFYAFITLNEHKKNLLLYLRFNMYALPFVYRKLFCLKNWQLSCPVRNMKFRFDLKILVQGLYTFMFLHLNVIVLFSHCLSDWNRKINLSNFTTCLVLKVD